MYVKVYQENEVSSQLQITGLLIGQTLLVLGVSVGIAGCFCFFAVLRELNPDHRHAG